VVGEHRPRRLDEVGPDLVARGRQSQRAQRMYEDLLGQVLRVG